MEQFGLTEEDIKNPIVINTLEEGWKHGEQVGIPIEEITENQYKSLMENVQSSTPDMLFD